MENFLACHRQLRGTPGWEAFEEDGLRACGAPRGGYLVNAVWGRPSPGHVDKVLAFFEGRPFHWYLTEAGCEGPLQDAGFSLKTVFPEMVHGLEDLDPRPAAPGLEIRLATTPVEVTHWIKMVSQSFQRPFDAVLMAWLPMIESAGCQPLIGYVEDRPVASALLAPSRSAAGIYCVATPPESRKRGYATALTHAALWLARRQGAKSAVLYATTQAVSVYKRLGFRRVAEAACWVPRSM
jgi:ribosomal protein S18 acetylase RimI-like enzyme